jgi:two-component system NtrC family sensor kinase
VKLHGHLQQLLAQLGLCADHPPDESEWRLLLEGASRRFQELDLKLGLFAGSMTGHWAEMRKLNGALAAERDQFASMLAAAPVGIARVLFDGTLSTANPALANIVGYTRGELEGQEAITFVDSSKRPAVAALVAEMAAGERLQAEGRLRLRHKGGGLVHTEYGAAVARDGQGVPQHIIIVVVDVTARRGLEVELRHAQKLESVGRLAAGIAHEINTPMQFIGDNVSFLRGAFQDLLELCVAYRQACDKADSEPLSGADQAALREAEEAADLDYVRDHIPRAVESTLMGARRVASIVQSMKSFAHSDRGELTVADLNAALRDTLTVASNELKYVADVETEFGDLPLVPCCLSDLNQVFLNLLINAAHAIGDVVGRSGGRGTIRVRTMVEGDQVVIAVSDTGTGIDERLRSRVFEPFFTTKPVGKGIGQGLAVARSVVDKHGGTLKFDTQPGRGTTFFIRLPLLHDPGQAQPLDAA